MADIELNSANSDALDLKQLLRTLIAVRKGDFSVRMPVEQTGLAGKIADALNDVIELNEKMAREFEHVSTVVGKEGKITQRASLGAVDGGWTSASPQSTDSLPIWCSQPPRQRA